MGCFCCRKHLRRRLHISMNLCAALTFCETASTTTLKSVSRATYTRSTLPRLLACASPRFDHVSFVSLSIRLSIQRSYRPTPAGTLDCAVAIVPPYRRQLSVNIMLIGLYLGVQPRPINSHHTIFLGTTISTHRSSFVIALYPVNIYMYHQKPLEAGIHPGQRPCIRLGLYIDGIEVTLLRSSWSLLSLFGFSRLHHSSCTVSRSSYLLLSPHCKHPTYNIGLAIEQHFPALQ